MPRDPLFDDKRHDKDARPLTPQDFIHKWRDVELKERTASQSHFLDLCRLLDIPDPVTADPKGDWFTFERGVSKASGGEGWADVWRKDCFGWEYKGKRRDLKAALNQLLGYSQSLGSPPLLIVSDTDRIEIHTNWNNTVQETHHIALEDLRDARKRDLLRACFTDPERLKPAKTRQSLTEDAAQKFAAIADRLRKRGHDPQAVAHFVNRLVFCMFAEDVELLPHGYFSGMIDRCLGRNDHLFQGYAQTLFAAMRTGGHVGFDKIAWFNGGLFDSDDALPLTYADLDDLKRAAYLDWSDIDPSIMGTLFERGLDPDKRSQLGAHYTDRDKIMQIVGPVIVQPLRAEWAAVHAQIEGAKDAKKAVLKSAFLERLANFRILHPACGSGNFLYLSLQALKDIEHQVNVEGEVLGLQRDLPRTGPENVLGIELNPYAAELARVSVWIGEIQWMRRNGFAAATNPILRTLNTIECRDAVLGPDGGRAAWPKADVVVGNPPFLGNKKMIAGLGEDYTVALRRAYKDVPGGVDLVAYWFARAWGQMQARTLTRAGLVATQSIRSAANRNVLKTITDHRGIFDAWSDEPWTVDGAAVRVSMVCFAGTPQGVVTLDGQAVSAIFPDLSPARGGADLTATQPMIENRGTAFQGPVKVGAFDVPGDTARDWLLLPLNPNQRPNADVLFPMLNGSDITKRDSGRWIIDFGERSEGHAALYERPFRQVLVFVKPMRDLNRDQQRRENWWRLGRSGSDLKAAMQRSVRAIFTPRVAKHRLFIWAAANVIPDSRVVAIARDDDTTFGILHSRFHELWSLALGGWHGDGDDGGRPQYTPSLGFETFPFPEHLTPNIPAAAYATNPHAMAIAAAAADLNTKRENWLNPADLVKRVPEVVPGYPDRILPVDASAAKILKTRTLTNLYNARPAWLTHAHATLDLAVADAYGWGDAWRAGMTDDDILSRLFHLNQTRAAAQSQKG